MGTVFLGLLAGCALATWVGTGMVRRYALANSLIDVPNERSSHIAATPRGGGLAIAGPLLIAFAVAAGVGLVEWRIAIALIGGGILVGGIGWIDDHSHVPARWRSLVHLLAAGWALAWLGGMEVLRLGAVEARLGFAGSLLAAVGIVWAVNLYNFMDGIDGIAGGEAVVVGGIGALLAWYTGVPSIVYCAALVAAVGAAFLGWNWPPARIFMGDIGSGLLGYIFAVLAVASETRGGPPLLVWLMLLGVFVFDGTVTLIRRVLHGERWYSAHRSHAYQRAVQAGWSHGRVSTAVVLITVLVGMIAALAISRPALLPLAMTAAFAVLAIGYLLVERRLPMYAAASRARPRAVNSLVVGAHSSKGADGSRECARGAETRDD